MSPSLLGTRKLGCMFLLVPVSLSSFWQHSPVSFVELYI